MARKSRRQVLNEQSTRQKVHREKMKAEKRPGRDDVARVALHWLIVKAEKTHGNEMLSEIGQILVKRLVQQGFNEEASREAFFDLVLRYTEDGWRFRRKTHLTAPYPESEFWVQH